MQEDNLYCAALHVMHWFALYPIVGYTKHARPPIVLLH